MQVCPSKKIWDFSSSEIDSEIIHEVKSHLELYSYSVVFKILGVEAGVFRGKLPLQD